MVSEVNRLCIDKRTDVINFLLAVKRTLQNTSRDNPSWMISTVREENMKTLSALEMNTNDVKDVILSLSLLDYIDGPFEDRSFPGQLWEFGKVVRGREVYIKLKLSSDKRESWLRVLSYHFPNKPIIYPFRN